jgi:hypothetical protein
VSNVTKSSGKWYFEAKLSSASKSLCTAGVMPASYVGKTTSLDSAPAQESYALSHTQLNASPYNGVAWGYDWSNQVVGIALDLDNRTVTFKGPTTYGPYPLSTPAGTPYVAGVTVWAGCSMTVNFGQSAFVRGVPSGFNAGIW